MTALPVDASGEGRLLRARECTARGLRGQHRGLGGWSVDRRHLEERTEVRCRGWPREGPGRRREGRVQGGQLPPAEPGCRPRKVLAAWALAYRIPLSASVTWSERPAPELAISEKHGQGSPLSVILVPGRVR